MSYDVDEYDLERSHELERRLDRDAEREPQVWRRPQRRPRYFSGLMFRPISTTTPVAASPAMSYIRVREVSQGRIPDDSALAAAEGRAGARGGNGSAQLEPARWPGTGELLGEAA